jgi:hypothetical protein
VGCQGLLSAALAVQDFVFTPSQIAVNTSIHNFSPKSIRQNFHPDSALRQRLVVLVSKAANP